MGSVQAEEGIRVEIGVHTCGVPVFLRFYTHAGASPGEADIREARLIQELHPITDRKTVV